MVPLIHRAARGRNSPPLPRLLKHLDKYLCASSQRLVSRQEGRCPRNNHLFHDSASSGKRLWGLCNETQGSTGGDSPRAGTDRRGAAWAAGGPVRVGEK